MTDHDEQRLREVMRTWVPEPPPSGAYGAQLRALAQQRRRTTQRLTIGAAAVAAVAVVVVSAVIGGSPAPSGQLPDPVASDPAQPALSCGDEATRQALAPRPTSVRLCPASSDLKGGPPRVPLDALVGDRATEFVAAVEQLPSARSPFSCPYIPTPSFRFVAGYSDDSTVSTRFQVRGCGSGVYVAGKRYPRVASEVLRIFLDLIHEQRGEVPPPLSAPTIECPPGASDLGSTLGADFPGAGEPGVYAVLCKYQYRGRASLLRESMVVDEPSVVARLIALADTDEVYRCPYFPPYGPASGDRVLLVDRFGDVVSATTGICTPYRVGGAAMSPDQQLQGLVNRLFRSTEAAG